MDTSTTNAVLNAFGIVYYLLRKNHVMVLLCMVVLLLTGSNVTNLLLVFVLFYLFIFQANKDQKSIIVVCLVMLVIFLLKISPQNNKYIKTMYQRLSKDIPKEKPVYLNTTSIVDLPDSILSTDERKQKIAQLYLDSMNREMVKANMVKSAVVGISPVKFTEKPVIPKDSIHTPSFQHKYDTTAIEKEMINFIVSQPSEVPIAASRKQNLRVPGKILSLQQTMRYFASHPLQLLTGSGMGNFSSKLAFKATAMKIAGGYPVKFRYINPAFKSNHLDLYLYYFTNKDDLHSIANSPNNTYDQLFSEYGIAGMVFFLVFYVGYFFRLIKKHSWSIPLGMIMLGAFFIEYWFEQLSIVVFFELLILLNNKEFILKKS